MGGLVPRADDSELLQHVTRKSQGMGLLGPAVARAEAPAGAANSLDRWLAAGYHGEMTYMARLGADRAEPRAWAPWGRSVALFADPYLSHPTSAPDPSRGLVSRYAQGDDYHTVLRRKLDTLCRLLEDSGCQARPFVDSSPLMEKALAAAGGLGWIGKNGNLLREEGSYFFLGGLLTAARWEPSPPVEELCGTCDLCLTACPTGAIVSPGVVDARRCISYLTIELKGAIPRPLRSALGSRIFGCDDCQEVCPWNASPTLTPDSAYAGKDSPAGATLLELARLNEQEYFHRYRGTPVRRARWRGFLRNVMVALGNWGSPEALPVLCDSLSHPEALVRQHAAWAVGRIGGATARAALQRHLQHETADEVRAEMVLALEEWAGVAGTGG